MKACLKFLWLSNTPTPSYTHSCGASAKRNKASITGYQAATASRLHLGLQLRGEADTDGEEDKGPKAEL